MSDSCFIYFLWAPLPHRCTHSLTTSKLLHSSYCPSILLFLLLSQPEYQPLLSVSPTPLPCLCSANLAYLPVQLYWRNSQKLYCISSLIPSMSSASPCSLCKRPISWGIASSYLSCPDQLSSLSKSLQLCPVPTFLCLESLEISRRRVLTLLLVLMSPWSTLSAPCLEGPEAMGKAGSSPEQLDTARGCLSFSWAEAMAWFTSMVPGALLLILGARGDSLKAAGSHVFQGCAQT